MSLIFKGTSITLDCEPDQAAGVKISGNVQFEKDVTIHGHLKLKGKVQAGTIAPPGWTPPYYDLTDELNNLKAKVAALETKVASLITQ